MLYAPTEACLPGVASPRPSLPLPGDPLTDSHAAALAALQGSQEQYRYAFAHAPIGMALVGLDGRWMQVNSALSQMVGYTEHELLRSDFQSITHPDDLHADLDLVRRLIANEIPHYQMMKRYLHKAGHIVWALLSVSLVRDDGGNPLSFISQIQDMTERQRMEDALRLSEEEHRAMFELAGVGKVQTELATGRFLRANKKLCDMLGYTPEELCTLSFNDVTLPEDRAVGRRTADAMIRGEMVDHTIEKRYRRKDGAILWVSINASIIRDPCGHPTRAVATIVDITARKHAEWLEQGRREVLEMLVEGRPLDEILARLASTIEGQISCAFATLLLIRDGQIATVKATAPAHWQEALAAHGLGLTAALADDAWAAPDHCAVSDLAADPVWKPFAAISHGAGIRSCWALPLQSADGPLGMLAIFLPHAQPPSAEERRMLDTAAKLAIVCIEHHNATHRLGHLVRHDALTGLANRLQFDDRLEQAIGQARRHFRPMGLLLVDLDRFKQINDTLGHQGGDHVLHQFAERLRGATRITDTVARIGGDEFAVVLPELHDAADAQRAAERIVAALAAPMETPGGPVSVSASIGVGTWSPGEDAAGFQERVDRALYRAKTNGRNGYCID